MKLTLRKIFVGLLIVVAFIWALAGNWTAGLFFLVLARVVQSDS